MKTAQYEEAKRLNTERNQRAVLRILQGTQGWITDVAIARLMGKSDSFERTVRDIIRDLRHDLLPIASESGRGYCWAPNDPEAMKATIADFRHRAKNMWETADLMVRGLYRELGGKKAAQLIDDGQQPMVI